MGVRAIMSACMFQRLSSQVAAALRVELERRRWQEALPGERVLAERFRVSRKTLRAALAELRGRGLVATEGRRGTRVKNRPRREPRATVRAALLLPTPLEHMRPFTVLWVGQLATSLREVGVEFEVLHNARCFLPGAAAALAMLTHQSPKECWILARSTRQAQGWFQRSRLPVIIAGSAHPGIDLPGVDLDYRALCRHAAGELLRLGHRRLALLHEDAGLAGDEESAEGFKDGCRGHGGDVPVPVVAATGRNPVEVIRFMRRWLERPDGPTGVLVSNPHLYLSVTSYAGASGWRIPRDLSVVCRDVEPYFRSLVPAPSHYRCPPEKFAAAMHRSVTLSLQGSRPASVKLMPDFVHGESIAGPHGRPQPSPVLFPRRGAR